MNRILRQTRLGNAFGNSFSLKRKKSLVQVLPTRHLLRLIELETRLVPASFTVSVYDDVLPSTDPDYTKTLSYAIEHSTDTKNTITFSSSKFNASVSNPIVLSDNLPTIASNIDFVGTGSDYVTINGLDSYTAFKSTSVGALSITLTALTVRNAIGSSIDITKGNVTLNNAVIRGNTVTGDGRGISVTEGNLTLNGCELFGSSVTGDGGAILMGDGDLTINDSILHDSTAVGSGGALFSVLGDIVLDNSTFKDCTASTGNGGGICFMDTEAARSITIKNGSVFDACTAYSNGGGVSMSVANALIEGSTFTDCSANAQGGAISAAAPLTVMPSLEINGVTISDCSAPYSVGGGIYLLDVHTSLITDSIISGCTTLSLFAA